jgi:rhodanese-related sulfurtransferase
MTRDGVTMGESEASMFVGRRFAVAASRVLAAAAVLLASRIAAAQAQADIQNAILGESNPRTKEISTEELRRVLADHSATVLDARPFREFAISHIPGARNVAAKPGVPMSAYVSDVAEIGRLLGGDSRAALILYCNGPYCGKSKRLAEELLAAGYNNVRRYQLGIPVWRALGEACEIEAEGLRYVLSHDSTAVLIDAREQEEFRAGALPGSRNVPRSLVLEGKDVGEIKRAKDDGRLPTEDHNTRLIVIARDAAAARYVAQAITHEAFHNVAYFAGSFAQAKSAVEP